MLRKIKELYYDYGFEILVVLSILIIITVAIYRNMKGESGTFSSTYFYDETIPKMQKNKNYFFKFLDKFNLNPNSNSNSNSNSNYNFSQQNRPIKKDSSGETECRRVLQKIFRKPFNKARPDFLRNPVTGGNFNLEIDCYNHDLKLGVEYNGRQHYDFIPYFHKNKEAFRNQKYRDYMKHTMCSQNNVTLIEVPYTISIENIEHYITEKLKKYYFR